MNETPLTRRLDMCVNHPDAFSCDMDMIAGIVNRILDVVRDEQATLNRDEKAYMRSVLRENLSRLWNP